MGHVLSGHAVLRTLLLRATELQRWAASPDYRAILGGVYPRRDADGSG